MLILIRVWNKGFNAVQVKDFILGLPFLLLSHIQRQWWSVFSHGMFLISLRCLSVWEALSNSLPLLDAEPLGICFSRQQGPLRWCLNRLAAGPGLSVSLTSANLTNCFPYQVLSKIPLMTGMSRSSEPDWFMASGTCTCRALKVRQPLGFRVTH